MRNCTDTYFVGAYSNATTGNTTIDQIVTELMIHYPYTKKQENKKNHSVPTSANISAAGASNDKRGDSKPSAANLSLHGKSGVYYDVYYGNKQFKLGKNKAAKKEYYDYHSKNNSLGKRKA